MWYVRMMKCDTYIEYIFTSFDLEFIQEKKKTKPITFISFQLVGVSFFISFYTLNVIVIANDRMTRWKEKGLLSLRGIHANHLSFLKRKCQN